MICVSPAIRQLLLAPWGSAVVARAISHAAISFEQVECAKLPIDYEGYFTAMISDPCFTDPECGGFNISADRFTIPV